MDFDAALQVVGEFGKYQRRFYLMVSLPVLLKGYQVMLLVFTVFVPKHRCAIPGLLNDTYEIQNDAHRQMVRQAIPTTHIANGDVIFESCLVYSGYTTNTTTHVNTTYNTTYNPWADNGTGLWRVGMEGAETEECWRWVYDQSEFTSTLITKFDLVCGRKEYRAHSNMMMMAGFLAGSTVVSILCDWMGRKRIYCACLVVMAAFGIANAFPTSPEMLLAFRFLSGMGLIGVMVSGFVLAVELIGGSMRTKLGAAWQIVWLVGPFVLAALSFLVKDWQYLQLVGSVPPVIFLIYWWSVYFTFTSSSIGGRRLVPESPRWLVSKNRIPEAMVTLKKVAEVNGRTCPPGMGEDLAEGNSHHHQQAAVSPLVVFRHRTLCVRFIIIVFNWHPTLCVRFLIIVFSWAVISMTYYGLSLNVSNLSGGVRVNFVASCVVELLGYGAAVCFLDILGRKRLHTISMVSAGLACLLTIVTVMFLPYDYQWVTTALAMVGKFGVSSSFAIIYLFSAELYPTVLRNFAVGSGSVFARIGSMLSPYIADLALYMEGELSTAVPLMVFGSLALGAGLSSLFLPETLHRTLPDTIHDAIHFGRRGGSKGIGGQEMTMESSSGKEEEEELKKDGLEWANGQIVYTIQQPDNLGQEALIHNNNHV
ncbi:hypothetical protein ACOMHN_043124 [Nucella lapillus]